MTSTTTPPESRYLSLPLLEIDGKKLTHQRSSNGASLDDPIMQRLMEDLIQITVEESLHLPGMFTLVIKNDYFPGSDADRPWRYKELLAIGKPVKIGFQSSTTEEDDFDEAHRSYVLEGEITGIETHFTGASQAPVIVRGYDVSHRLHRGRYNRSFQNITDSDIVKKIAEESQIKTATVDPSGAPHSYVFQENQTNMEFLRERAARNGFELFVKDGKLNFRKPAQAEEALELKWLKNLDSFRVRVTTAEQVNEVEVRGWDYARRRAIVSTKSSAEGITKTDNGKGQDTSRIFKTPPPKMVVVDRPVFSQNEADKIAQALCNELGGEFVYADAQGEGDPRIRVGRAITLKDMGPYDGKYYVTETRHSYHERVYRTELSVRGLRGGNLLEILAPKHSLEPGQTLLVGIVTHNDDPEGWGRVRVKFPTLTEEHSSNWARVVAIGAGDGRGFDCLPEINDEVLVAFEHGDIHRPYIIGNVWNGQHKPPESVTESVYRDKVRLRTFKTRVGHRLQFVDDDKSGSSQKKGVYIETAGGHKLRLNDSDHIVEVETAGGHKLTLNDTQQSIALSSTGSIDIGARTSINIHATGEITINGAIIKLN